MWFFIQTLKCYLFTFQNKLDIITLNQIDTIIHLGSNHSNHLSKKPGWENQQKINSADFGWIPAVDSRKHLLSVFVLSRYATRSRAILGISLRIWLWLPDKYSGCCALYTSSDLCKDKTPLKELNLIILHSASNS